MSELSKDELQQRLFILENVLGNMMRILSEADGDLVDPIGELEEAWGQALVKVSDSRSRIIKPE